MKREKNPLEQQFLKIEDMLTKVTYAALDFWNLETDAAADFKYYFKEHNPNRLVQFKTNPSKVKPRDMIFGIYAHKKPTLPAGTFITNTSNSSQVKETLDLKFLSNFFWFTLGLLKTLFFKQQMIN